MILTAEAASAFDGVTRSGQDARMVRQVADAWPNVFRQGQLISAVEYLRAQRVRRTLAQELDRLLNAYEVVVHPSGDDGWVIATNLSGHPTVCAPTVRDERGAWGGVSFTARAFGEARALAIAEVWQRAGTAHLAHPDF
jgi:Asp-tRNA(Asn)/Glu-tRNA(Gln) amidotransferase A subunit family amidase